MSAAPLAWNGSIEYAHRRRFLFRRHAELVADSTPILLGSSVQFSDGQRANLTALEVDESWEVLNIVVSRGFLRWKEQVKLPFTAAPRWSEALVELSCTSAEAFAREIPPIAAPARPMSEGTPTALSGGKILGALVNGPTRRVTALIVESGARRLRVPATDVSFEGKVMHVTTPPDTLPEHRSDEEITREAWRRLSSDRGIAPDELHLLKVDSAGGSATLSGNVRRKQTRERAEALVSGVAGITRLENKIADDLQLEADLGWALERAGVQRTASIQGRSSLGQIILYGQAPSRQIVDDAVRTASALNGARDVKSRVQIGTAPRAAVA